MSGTSTKKHKFCYKCGTKMSIGAIYCPKCGVSQKEKSVNRINKTASTLGAVISLLGFLIGAFGAILIVGSVIGLLMKGPMENPNTKRAWAIGQIFYYLFIATGFIDVSLGLGFACFIAGCIMFYVGDKAM